MKVLSINLNYNNIQIRGKRNKSVTYNAEDFKAIDSGDYGYSYKHVEFINKKNLLPTLHKNSPFCYQDYQNLSKAEKQIINILNEMGADAVSYDGTKNLSIKKDAARILKMSIKTKEKLDKEYPNGYKLVGVGNSPSALVETMHDLLGADAVTLPFSKGIFTNYKFPFQHKSLNPYHNPEKFEAKDWENYLKFFGIYKNFTEETGKALIFTDFVSDGDTKYCIESLLRGLGFDENARFINILDLMSCKTEDKDDGIFLKGDRIDLYRYIMGGGLKRYARKPSIRYYFSYENIIKNPKYYISCSEPESFKFKLFRCALYDLISKKKKFL